MMCEKQCRDCRYFLQHYSLDERKLFRVYCGHCTYRRIKGKKPDAKACGNFEQGVDRAEAFASKEYLSKTLLKYVLELDLLPEVE